MSQNKKERHESRIIAVKTLFVYLSREERVKLEDVFSHVVEVDEKEKDDFAEILVHTALENIAKVRLIVKAFAPEFPFEKIAPINRVVLILGVCELKYFDTPPIVVINEYIEIAKEFGEERSASFINGVLDAFRKSIGKQREDGE
ncbi:transcription antitermination factor NusB [Candidatus Gracilibacteria bacterium]|nr:transcription antitermination factor NusB [Candidatus Gracilibacteria bacterium]